MADSSITLDVRVDTDAFRATVADLQRALIGVGRAARRSAWSISRFGEQLPNAREARIVHRMERRRRLRMLREQHRNRKRWQPPPGEQPIPLGAFLHLVADHG